MGEDSSDSFLVDAGRPFKELLKMVDFAETKLKSFLPSYMRPSISPSRPLILGLQLTDRSGIKSTLDNDGETNFGAVETLLEVDDVGGEDNFFQLGGGSVLALRLVSMAGSKGLTLTVSGIFNKPTLREIASTVRHKTDTADIAPFALLPGLDITNLRRQAASQYNMEPHKIEDIYPCSFFQLHYVTGYPEACSDPKVDPWLWKSQGAYSIPPCLDLNRFQDVWNMAVQRHPVLRTRLIHTPSGIFQVVLKSCKPAKWNIDTDLTEYLLNDQVDYMTFGEELLRLGIVKSEDSNK
ncbi:hypothetical protein IFR05_000203 [Cadophora sp. M221]|nr:hypothetical protein IFR05_000203 [Cadophora sp. M221]